jgi:hypothetical protein
LSKKIFGILLIATLAIVLTASLSYYAASQPNQTQNNLLTPTPTPEPTPTPTSTPSPSETPTETASTPKPSVPEFTLNFIEHSHDVSPIYGIDQFTGENITIQEGAHYQWTTLDFTIKNQQVPSDSRLYYNIRYKGQYTNNWTELYHGDTYIQQQSGEYTTISFLVSGSPSPEAHTSTLPIPSGAQVDFQVEAMIGGIYRISPRFSSGYEFRGETSGWSSTQTITIP